MGAYIALLRKDPDTDYSVHFPDLPGCITAGLTLTEAYAFAHEALALYIESLREDGESVPAPSSLAAVMGDPENRDAVAILVAAPPM